MRIFCKAIPPQIPYRAPWYNEGLVEGIEVPFLGTESLEQIHYACQLAANNFPSFTLEVPDVFHYDRVQPFDLLTNHTRVYLDSLMNIVTRFRKCEHVVCHMRGGCILDYPPYDKFKTANFAAKEDILGRCREVIVQYPNLVVENTFPIDPVDRKGWGVMCYPIGKISEDFRGLRRVVDTAHLGLAGSTFAGLPKKSGKQYWTSETPRGQVPVYMGPAASQERLFRVDTLDHGLMYAVKRQIRKALNDTVEIHFNGNVSDEGQNQLDGAGFSDKSYLDLRDLWTYLKPIISENVIVIPEVGEPTKDYVNAPNQRRNLKMLRQEVF